MKRHYSSLVKILKTLEAIGTFLILLISAIAAASIARTAAGSAFVQTNALGIIVGILLGGVVLAAVFYIGIEWSIAVIDLLSRVEMNTRLTMEKKLDQ